MKINEILNEAGFLKSVGKGLADIVAPGAWDKSRRDLAVKSASTGGDVEYNGLKYRWLGNQWGVINPDTNKVSPAGKDMQARLNFWAQRNPAKQKQQTQDPVGSYAPPKADKVININGYNYHWADQRWTREDGKVITNPDGIQTLNKASYSIDAPGNVNAPKTPKPKVPYSVIQQQQNQNQEQISPAPNAGAPTADEQANLQAKLQAAMAKQNQGV